jgi:Ser/Thr protein kinase RdoA (MazF antagonist)
VRWLAGRYGLGDAAELRPVGRGAMGRIFCLRANGREYAAKELFWDVPSADHIAEVVAFTDRCRTAGIRAPTTLADRSGDLVVTHPATGRGWLIQSWVDGAVPPPTDVDTARWLAQQAAVIHGLAVDAPGYDDSDEGLRWYCRVRDDFAEIAEASADACADWADRWGTRAGSFSELASLANESAVGATVRCHRDLTNDNVLVDDDGVRTLLDWDNAGPHEPWREVGNLCMPYIRDPDAVAAVVDDYARAGGASLPRGPTLFSTGVAVWLNFIRTRALMVLDGTFDADVRGDAEEAVHALLRDMPSVADLERAAAAIR